eukprot:1625095-Amphidinium_carterae.1
MEDRMFNQSLDGILILTGNTVSVAHDKGIVWFPQAGQNPTARAVPKLNWYVFKIVQTITRNQLYSVDA